MKKKVTAKKNEKKLEPVVTQLQKLGGQLGDQLEKAHAAFHQFDAAKQKRILATIAGAVAVLAGVRAVKKHVRNKKKVM